MYPFNRRHLISPSKTFRLVFELWRNWLKNREPQNSCELVFFCLLSTCTTLLSSAGQNLWEWALFSKPAAPDVQAVGWLAGGGGLWLACETTEPLEGGHGHVLSQLKVLVERQGHPVVCLCPLGLERPWVFFFFVSLQCHIWQVCTFHWFFFLLFFLFQAMQLCDFSEPSLCLPAHRKLCLLYGLTCANVLTPSWCTEEAGFEQWASGGAEAVHFEPPVLLQEARVPSALALPMAEGCGEGGLWSRIQDKALVNGHKMELQKWDKV